MMIPESSSSIEIQESKIAADVYISLSASNTLSHKGYWDYSRLSFNGVSMSGLAALLFDSCRKTVEKLPPGKSQWNYGFKKLNDAPAFKCSFQSNVRPTHHVWKNIYQPSAMVFMEDRIT